MAYKRKRTSKSTKPYSKRYKKARTSGTTGYAGILRASLNQRVRRIESTIETKESTQTTSTNLALPHNDIRVIYNPMQVNVGTGDPMTGVGNRIGDQITVKGLKIKMFLQNQAARPKVWYRIFVVKSSSGDTISRATLFKGLVGNKMIDQYDTERFTVVAQKTLCLTTSPAQTAQSFAVPSGAPQTGNGSTVAGGIATKVVSMWIPGRKFGYNGIVKFKNGSSTEPKFFDYRVVILAYDLFGTPQDANNVGALSEGYCKLYYKDA